MVEWVEGILPISNKFQKNLRASGTDGTLGTFLSYLGGSAPRNPPSRKNLQHEHEDLQEGFIKATKANTSHLDHNRQFRGINLSLGASHATRRKREGNTSTTKEYLG